jgi:hypothetical protein
MVNYYIASPKNLTFLNSMKVKQVIALIDVVNANGHRFCKL